MAQNAETDKETRAHSKHIPTQLALPKDLKKPAQVYQILKERHAKNPIFLFRTLNYMTNRMSRKNNKRANFKASTLLNQCIRSIQSESSSACLKIDFIGYFIYLSPIAENKSTTWVNATLLKIIKSGSNVNKFNVEEVLRLSSNVAVNPYGSVEPIGSIYIPLNAFKSIDEPNVDYKLLFNIETFRQKTESTTMIFKLRTLSRIHKGEFSFFNKSSSVIPEGNYEVIMRETKMTEKNTLDGLQENKLYNKIKTNPRLKFHLSWLPVASNQLPKQQSTIIDCKKFMPSKSRDLNNNETVDIQPKTIQITYNFLNRNNKQHSQHILKTTKITCLWCSLDCIHLDTLLKHLELCHERFRHKCQSTTKGAHIDISINNSYNVAVELAKATKSTRLMQDDVNTEWLVYRKRQHKSSFKNIPTENKITQHRQYFHSSTLLPIHPNELSIDSEEEHSPEFLVHRMFKMVDKRNVIAQKEEKTLMKLWNMHIMKQRYVSPRHIRLVCEKFVDSFGFEIVRRNIYNAFILHLSKLFDENLLTAKCVWRSINKVREMMANKQAAENNDLTQLQPSVNFQPIVSNKQKPTTSNSQKKKAGNTYGIKQEPLPVIVGRNPDMKPTRRSARLLAFTNCE